MKYTDWKDPLLQQIKWNYKWYWRRKDYWLEILQLIKNGIRTKPKSKTPYIYEHQLKHWNQDRERLKICLKMSLIKFNEYLNNQWKIPIIIK